MQGNEPCNLQQNPYKYGAGILFRLPRRGRAMSNNTVVNKWTKFGELLGAVRPGGTEHSLLGTAIDVSSNGTTSLPASVLQDIVLKRFAEMNVPADSAAAASVPDADKSTV
jgi:hypothetical protein